MASPTTFHLSNNLGSSNLFTACRLHLLSRPHRSCSQRTAPRKISFASTTPGPVTNCAPPQEGPHNHYHTGIDQVGQSSISPQWQQVSGCHGSSASTSTSTSGERRCSYLCFHGFLWRLEPVYSTKLTDKALCLLFPASMSPEWQPS